MRGWTALSVYLGFVLLHGLLLLGTWDVIDQEELEFGTVPMLLVDGEADAIGPTRTIQREGSQVLLAPVVALGFALFGTSMLALKAVALLLTGLWAVLWYAVARRAVPHVPNALVATCFLLPTPLVQRSAISAASIHTHLGASAIHAGVILLLLRAVDGGGRRWLLLGGAVAGLGVFFSLTLAPLLVGVAALAWAAGRWRGLLLFGAAALPGAALQVRGLLGPGGPAKPGVGGFLTGTLALDPAGLSPSNLLHAAAYGPGFPAAGWEQIPFLRYSPWGAALTVAALLAGVLGARARRAEGAAVRRALLISALVFTPLLVLGEGGVRGDLFDGPRYVLPLLPLLTIAALHGAGRAGWLLPPAHALGFALLFRAAVFPAPWWTLRGAEPWLDRRPQPRSFTLDDAPEVRRARYALWTGMRAVPDRGPFSAARELVELAARQGLEGDEGLAPAEFWRGVGYSLEVWTEGVERGVGAALLEDPKRRRWLWQGAAMAWKCADPAPLLARAGPAQRDALAWGRGRVDLFCRRFGGPPIDSHGLGPPFFDGLGANWALDLADRPDREATPEALRSLEVYARFDLREQLRRERAPSIPP